MVKIFMKKVNDLLKTKRYLLRYIFVFIFSLCVYFAYDYYRVTIPDKIILETIQFDADDIKNKMGPLLNEIARKYVVVSSNLESKANTYLFNLPMVCMAWRRLNFEPIVLIVSSKSSQINRLANKSIEYLKLFNIKIAYIEAPSNYETMTGMLSRLFVGLLPDDFAAANDFIITSDSDLYPVNKEYYNLLNSNALVAWNAYCCGVFKHEKKYYEMYPISHIGMKKWQWLDVMKINANEYKLNGESILAKISQSYNRSVYIKANNQINKGDSVWFLDQMLISINIKNYLNEKPDSKLEKIAYTGTRLDRSMTKRNWMRTLQLNFDSITDCHSFQANVHEEWSLLQPLFLKLFEKKFKLIFDKYYYEYNEIMKLERQQHK